MTVLSIRFRRPGVYERLKRRAANAPESISAIGERLIDEGLRMEAHPGIVFRDGPSGRRAGLVAGPDVWEVAALLKGLRGTPQKRVERAAAQLEIPSSRVRAAVRYYAEFSEEIDAQVAANEEAADREASAWETERRLLSG